MCRNHGNQSTCSPSSPSIFALRPPIDPKDDHLGLFKPAPITSIEAKYVVHPHIAEFWCTVTSCAFALPLLMLIYPPPGGLHYSLASGINSIPVEAPLFLSVMTALWSTLYHWTLWDLFSTFDEACAIMTFYSASLVMLQAAGHDPHSVLSYLFGGNFGSGAGNGNGLFFLELPGLLPGFASREVQLLSVLVIVVLFVVLFRRAVLPVALFAVVLPIPVYLFWVLGSPESSAWIVVSVCFFLADRLKIAPTHPLWHLFGGYALYHCLYTSLAYYNQVHVFERSGRIEAMLETFHL